MHYRYFLFIDRTYFLVYKMWSENYQWHYDYVRLAWDTGFSFEKCKFPDLNKNKICVVDIDRIVKERDVASVERFIPTVIQYILDNEQAEVLDTNFVKMFRISQLSVEYLLFCKKYLDNTVVLFKKELSKLKEENKELQSYTRELESHIHTLTKLNSVTTFKCSKCSKIFSSEEYLNSHLKRRHSTEDIESNPTSETVQLQSEIKHLKERLNNTEKLLHEKEDKQKENVEPSEKNMLKVNEIQQKFDAFKQEIEKELNDLRMQKTFYEEKYGKLFDLVMNQNDIIHNNSVKHSTNVETVKSKPEVPEKVEHTTQTQPVVLKRENIKNKNLFEFKETKDMPEVLESSNNACPMENTLVPEIEKKINEFELTVENKISSTLQHIEGQMQAFWNRLHEFNSPTQATNHTFEGEVTAKPPIKPRSKFTQPTKTTQIATDNIDRLKPEIDKLETQKNETLNVKFVKSALHFDSSESVSESHDTFQELLEEPVIQQKVVDKSVTKSSASNLKSRSVTSKNSLQRVKENTKTIDTMGNLKEVKESKEIIDKLCPEIEHIISLRLQEIGISPAWKGLPDKTFTKVMDIIKHQANLTAKAYPNFGNIKNDIEKSLEKKHVVSPSNNLKKKLSSPGRVQQQNIVHIGYRKKSRNPQKRQLPHPTKSEIVTIRNRSLYDTDTESDNVAVANENISKTAAVVTPEKKFSAVVEELKTRDFINVGSQNDANKDKDVPSKGVLKNYPSIGALSKKKVLFDIDSDSSKTEDVPVVQVVGGSTTSVASSIFDGKEKATGAEKSVNKKDNDFDSLSDFDLSEL